METTGSSHSSSISGDFQESKAAVSNPEASMENKSLAAEGSVAKDSAVVVQPQEQQDPANDDVKEPTNNNPPTPPVSIETIPTLDTSSNPDEKTPDNNPTKILWADSSSHWGRTSQEPIPQTHQYFESHLF